MDKEIHIYNYHEAKPSNDGSQWYHSKAQWIVIIFVVFLMTSLSFVICKACFDGQEKEKAWLVKESVKAEPVAVQKSMPVHPAEPVYNTTPSGAVVTTVTTSVVSSPYTWNYIVQDVVTKDSIHVSLYLKITSQIIEGQEKVLLQNYGGNWFYTVFIPGFQPFVKSFIQSRCNEDAMYKLPHDEKTDSVLTAAAKAQIKCLSQKILLPVVIKQVKVVSVQKNL